MKQIYTLILKLAFGCVTLLPLAVAQPVTDSDATHANSFSVVIHANQTYIRTTQSHGLISVISLDDAASAMSKLEAESTGIAYRYPAEGCEARATLACEELRKMKISCGRIWSTNVAGESVLTVKSANSPTGAVTWKMHVAPTVYIRQGHAATPYVLDPTLFDHPVTVAEWTKAQTASLKKNQFHTYLTSGDAFGEENDRGDLDPATRAHRLQDAKHENDRLMYLQLSKEGRGLPQTLQKEFPELTPTSWRRSYYPSEFPVDEDGFDAHSGMSR